MTNKMRWLTNLGKPFTPSDQQYIEDLNTQGYAVFEGEPQELTAHNAVASTFGKRGEEYSPCVQS